METIAQNENVPQPEIVDLSEYTVVKKEFSQTGTVGEREYAMKPLNQAIDEQKKE